MTTTKKIAVLSLLTLAACAQSLPQAPPNWEEISKREGTAFKRYNDASLACSRVFFDPVKKANAALNQERDRVAVAAGLDLRGVEDQGAILRRMEAAIARVDSSTSYEQLQAQGAAWDALEKKEKAALAWSDIQLAALDKCEVEAGVRLKAELWAPAPTEASVPSTASPNWHEIADQNHAAVERYYSEVKACNPFPRTEVGGALEALGNPSPGSEAWRQQSQIVARAFDEESKCDIEAAARLKPQLWSS
jgi:hypothetical protein